MLITKNRLSHKKKQICDAYEYIAHRQLMDVREEEKGMRRWAKQISRILNETKPVMYYIKKTSDRKKLKLIIYIVFDCVCAVRISMHFNISRKFGVRAHVET